jgi:hypothetical protein
MTKVLIQPTVQIGAHTYDIVWWNKKMQHAARSAAQASAHDHIIRLDPTWADTFKFEQLLHEILHQVDFLINDPQNDEHCVLIEGAFLTQAILSLGIEPDFSLIKEEKL